MKRMIIITTLVMLFIGYVVWQASVYKSPTEVNNLIGSLKEAGCSDSPPREAIMLGAKSADIRRLGELERLCASQVTDLAYLTVIVPTSNESAKFQATRTVEAVTELNEFGIKPIIFFELNEAFIKTDFQNLERGQYDVFLESYFKELVGGSITDDMIYGWIIIPRPNQPIWSKAYIAPVDYPKYFKAITTPLKEVYPEARLGVYFNSSTYEQAPIDKSQLDIRSLAPYVQNLNPEDIAIAGIEGYPWMPEVGKEGEMLLEPKEYLPQQQIDELLSILNVQDLLIGTGSFVSIHTKTDTGKTLFPAETRKELLDKVVNHLEKNENEELNVVLVLKMTDLSTKDGTDWSYYGTEHTENILHEKVLIDFLRNLYNSKIKVAMEF